MGKVKGRISAITKHKIIKYVESHGHLKDKLFHNYVMGLGVEPWRAEEIIYGELRKQSKKHA